MGARLVSPSVRVHVNDWPPDDSLDDDSRIVSNGNPWNCPFNIVLDGKSVDVRRHSKLQVSCCVLAVVDGADAHFSIFRGLSAFLGGAYAIQYFFAGVSIIGFFFALLFLPETHGKKLSEIEDYFKGKKKPTARPAKKRTVGGANNRKPKQALETVNESEKMIKGPNSV